MTQPNDTPAKTPDGWRSLDETPDEAEPVQGLLSNGAITDAEWWGPVPEELWGPDGQDGSGWAWSAIGPEIPDFGAGLDLVAWRPAPAKTPAVAKLLRDQGAKRRVERKGKGR